MNKTIIGASILTANFLELKNDLDKLKKANVKWIHYDVMDYNFVSNLSFGPKILQDICKEYDFNIDIHLMVRIHNLTVEEYLEPFLHENVKQMTLHYEALYEQQIEEFIDFCKEHNIKASLAINPESEVIEIENFLSKLDNVLIMSVHPGFGGQKFIEDSLLKIEILKRLKKENNFNYTIQIDGGINKDTYKLVKKAGIESIVAGSYLVDKNIYDLEKRVQLLEE